MTDRLTKYKYNGNLWYLELNRTNILLRELSVWWSRQKTSLASPPSCSSSIAFLEHLRSILLIWNHIALVSRIQRPHDMQTRIWRHFHHSRKEIRNEINAPRELLLKSVVSYGQKFILKIQGVQFASICFLDRARDNWSNLFASMLMQARTIAYDEVVHTRNCIK